MIGLKTIPKDHFILLACLLLWILASRARSKNVKSIVSFLVERRNQSTETKEIVAAF